MTSKVRANNFAISLDGYGAGPDQTKANPLGVGGEALHDWFVGTRTFKSMYGKEGGTTGPDDDFASRMHRNVGAWVMGRHMFGPAPDEPNKKEWRGWWGDNPPYHVPAFILTSHGEDSIPMEGGTTFHFVTGGLMEAHDRAQAAADERDIVVGGGVAVIRQFLEARLLDELHVAIAPILLGGGESLFAGLDLPALGYRVIEHVPTAAATHVVIARS